jgi:hypothetical protein
MIEDEAIFCANVFLISVLPSSAVVDFHQSRNLVALSAMRGSVYGHEDKKMGIPNPF